MMIASNVFRTRNWLAVAASVVIMVAGCNAPGAAPLVSASVIDVMSAPIDAGFDRAYAPIEFAFPRDHGPHPTFGTEWWYYTGNLQAADGAAFGYQLTFFRIALTATAQQRTSALAANQVYMAHFALTDSQRQTHTSFERFSRGAAGLAGATATPTYSVWLEDWSAATVGDGVVRLRASANDSQGSVALDLRLKETRSPLLHGDRGLHQKGPEPGNASYYYSLVGLETTGVITSAGQSIAVTGVSWMDHEFGTSALAGDVVGWDWFSLQLDNGAALMLYQFRTANGRPINDVQGTLAWPDGRQVALNGTDFSITATAEWTSPATKATYPSAWRIDIPEQQLTLAVTPLLADQEMDVSFVYWEGAVEARGVWDEQPIQGRGYVELTGYAETARGYQR